MSKARRFGALSYVDQNIRRRSLRSAITIVGISAMIAFFILFASISQRLNNDIIDEIASFADRIITIKDGRLAHG